MKRGEYGFDKIKINELNHKYKLNIKKLHKLPKDAIPVTDVNWYPGIAYYQTPDGKRYSIVTYTPISNDEMCIYGSIHKVKKVIFGDGQSDFYHKTVSTRDDNG